MCYIPLAENLINSYSKRAPLACLSWWDAVTLSLLSDSRGLEFLVTPCLMVGFPISLLRTQCWVNLSPAFLPNHSSWSQDAPSVSYLWLAPSHGPLSLHCGQPWTWVSCFLKNCSANSASSKKSLWIAPPFLTGGLVPVLSLSLNAPWLVFSVYFVCLRLLFDA